jgi:V/A-type H+-transporting ATPase subunit A
VTRISGALVEATVGPDVAMGDIVELGPRRLTGEVVRIRGDRAGLQAYEYTGGLRPGDPVRPTGRPLSAPLGPHLLGSVVDGLLRPLSGAPRWLAPGAAAAAADAGGARWRFRPQVREGMEVGEGATLGTLRDGGPLELRVLVPPGVSGRVAALRADGAVSADDDVATLTGATGSVEVGIGTSWPVRRPRPVRERLDLGPPLHTGQRVVDVLFPVARGSTAAVPGGFGTGKTVLLQQIAKWCDADVIVYVGCGERGNEMADTVAELGDLVDPRTGGRLSQRTVVIANTSNMPVMAREASVYAGVTVAEYFRDMGLDTVVIADSTSRWAEALREFAARTGALPAEEGFPASLASALAAFYERAGRAVTLGGDEGSVTVIGAVSPPGGDVTEPVTVNTERFTRTVWSLDRTLAYARHYPAVSWAGSFSRDAATVAPWHARAGDPGWAARRAEATALLSEADRLTELVELVGMGALPGRERVVLLAGRLLREGVLQQSALSRMDASSSAERSAALVSAVLDVVAECRRLVEAGTAATTIEEVDLGPLLRAREEVGDAEGPEAAAAGIAARRDEVLARLRERA